MGEPVFGHITPEDILEKTEEWHAEIRRAENVRIHRAIADFEVRNA